MEQLSFVVFAVWQARFRCLCKIIHVEIQQNNNKHVENALFIYFIVARGALQVIPN